MISLIKYDIIVLNNIFEKIACEEDRHQLLKIYNDIENRIQQLLKIRGIGCNMGTLMKVDCLICRFSRLDDINGDLEKRYNSLNQQLIALYDSAP